MPAGDDTTDQARKAEQDWQAGLSAQARRDRQAQQAARDERAERLDLPDHKERARLSDSVRRWWSVATIVVGLLSGAAGTLIGATWQVASYDSRLSTLTTQGGAQGTTLSALSLRLSAMELGQSQYTERVANMQRDVSNLQDNAGHVNDRLDSLRDQTASLREAQAGLSAQLGFLYQHPTGKK